MGNKKGIDLKTIGLVIGAIVLIAFATGSDIGNIFNTIQGKDPQGNPLFSVEGSAELSGALTDPRIRIDDIRYTIKESGFLGASVGPMNIGGALDVRAKAQLIQNNQIIRESIWRNMGDFGIFGEKIYTFKIAKVPEGDYTLRILVKHDEPIGSNSEEIQISVG